MTDITPTVQRLLDSEPLDVTQILRHTDVGRPVILSESSSRRKQVSHFQHCANLMYSRFAAMADHDGASWSYEHARDTIAKAELALRATALAFNIDVDESIRAFVMKSLGVPPYLPERGEGYGESSG